MAKTKTAAPPPLPKTYYKGEYDWAPDDLLDECSTLNSVEDVEAHRGDPALYNFNAFCTALVVGSDDVAPSYSVGVLTRRQIRRREGSRGARVVASY